MIGVFKIIEYMAQQNQKSLVAVVAIEWYFRQCESFHALSGRSSCQISYHSGGSLTVFTSVNPFMHSQFLSNEQNDFTS